MAFSWTYAYLFLILGIALTIIGQAFVGKAKTRKLMTWIGLPLAILGLISAFGIFPIAALNQEISFATGTIPGGGSGGGSSGGMNGYWGNVVLTLSGIDKQSPGTAVSGIAQYSPGGTGVGWTTFTSGSGTGAQGVIYDFLLKNASTYHSAYVGVPISGALLIPATTADGASVTSSVNIQPNKFPMVIQMNRNGTVTENIYTTTGVVLSNSAGTANTQNQTDLGDGGVYNFKDEMTANAFVNTQDMVCVIEVLAGTNVSTANGVTLSLNGANIPVKSTATPAWYTPAGTGSRVWIFDVAPLDSTATRTFNIGLTSLSTGRMSATSYVKKSCYTKEYFQDTNSADGKIVYDVADSANTKKSMADYSYVFYFQ